MVVILTEEADHSTNEVLAWLDKLDTNYIRINETDHVSLRSMAINDETVQLEISGSEGRRSILVDQDTRYWYRRGFFNFDHDDNHEDLAQLCTSSDVPRPYFQKLKWYLENESKYSAVYLHAFLKKIKHINSFQDNYLNKLQVLLEAKRLGIAIPNTIVTTDKCELEKFVTEHGVIISKPIYQVVSYHQGNEYIDTLTKKFNDQLNNRVPEKFFPTLFQNFIDKRYELRIFFLDGNFYSSAIFSQNDQQTAEDFRRYNADKPNRVVPHQLPEEVKIKLAALFKHFKMICGSVDMAIDQQGNYILFEINPIGQFQQVSIPCNYYLEQKIANYLYETH